MLNRVKFIKKENEYDDVYTFIFEKNKIDYKAGQYANVLAIGEKREERVLSFSSHPSEDAIKFTMHTDTNSPFKNTMMNLIEGDIIFLYRIEGKLKFPIDNEVNYVFLSGGVGIAPYRSIIKENTHDELKVTVAQVQEESYLFKDKLHPIVNKYIEIHPDNFNSDILNLIESNRDAIFYICGSRRFIDGVGTLFKKTNFPSERIQIESFKKKGSDECITCTCGLREVCNC